jgi:magnesium-protoporphyrin O-methyltransferase
MPDCSCCNNLERAFDDKAAQDDLDAYLEDGPDRSTVVLLEALRERGVGGRTLLDIGGGIGAIQVELLAAGAASAIDVDISRAYIATARKLAADRGFADRTDYRQGDFVTLAPDIPAADVVTLDRVICCYPDLDALAAAAGGRASERLGLVHPRDAWFMRWGVTVMNLVSRPFRQPRFFVHRVTRLEAILAAAGLEREWAGGTRFWRVAIYRRAG